MPTSLQGIANQIFDVLFASPEETTAKTTTPTTDTDQDMRLITANVRKDMTTGQAQKTAALLKGRASLIGFQEIESPEHHAAIAKALPGFQFTHPHLECPFGVDPTVWTVIDTGAELVHNGLDHASPNRYNAWVTLQSRVRPSLPPIAAINTHMVVKSKTSSLPAPAWRSARWQEHLTALRKRVHALSGNGKTTVFIMGDFNSTDVPIPNVRWIANGGIDKIGVLQGSGITAVKKGSFRIATPSDHDALGLSVQLRKN